MKFLQEHYVREMEQEREPHEIHHRLTENAASFQNRPHGSLRKSSQRLEKQLMLIDPGGWIFVAGERGQTRELASFYEEGGRK